MRSSALPSLVAAFAVGLPLALVGGCPAVPEGIDLPASVAGTYWVEYADGALAVFELPAQRGQEGVWHRFEAAEPAWYTGPAVYEVSEDGGWVRLSTQADLTLDEVLQLHDPPPIFGADGSVPMQ